MILRSPIISERKMREMQHSNFSSFIGAFFNRSKRDYSRLLADPTSSSLIMAVMLWICRRWPEAPLYLENPKGDAVKKHAMLNILANPNKAYSGASLFFGAIMSFIWDGNGYIAKIRNKRDLGVKELWYIPHFLIEPKVRPGSTSFIDFYEYKPGGAVTIELLPEDVIHLRYGIDPYNQRKGFSPLKSVIRDAVTDEEADNFASSMLLNMGVPGILFSPDFSSGTQPGAIDVDAAKKYLKEQFSGDHRGEPLVQSGPTKVQQFGFDPKSMDLATLRAIPEERISAVTGIPAAVVGFGSGLAQTKVGATMAELREMAYEDGIIPIQRLVAGDIESQLLPDYEPYTSGWKVRFDLSGVRVLQDDQDALYKRTIDAFNGGLISRAQGKQALGFEASPSDEIRRVPFSVTEVPEGQMAPEQPAEKSLKSRKASHAREKAFAKAQASAGERHRAAYIQELADGFEAIANRCVAAYEDTVTSLAGAKPSERKQDGTEPPEEIDPESPEGIELQAEAAKIKANAEYAGPLSDALSWKGHYLAVSKTTFANIDAIFGISLNIPDQVQREVISKGGRHFALVGVERQTQAGIFKALCDGRTMGLGPREIARRIRYEVDGATMYPGIAKEAHDRALARGWSEEKATMAGDKAARQYRAEVIARTETKYAQNVSAIEAAKASGTFNAMMAFDSQKGSFDEDCDERNGQIYSFEQSEIETESEHPNGTLSWSPTIIGRIV